MALTQPQRLAVRDAIDAGEEDLDAVAERLQVALGAVKATAAAVKGEKPKLVWNYRCPGCGQHVTYRPCQICVALLGDTPAGAGPGPTEADPTEAEIDAAMAAIARGLPVSDPFHFQRFAVDREELESRLELRDRAVVEMIRREPEAVAGWLVESRARLLDDLFGVPGRNVF